MSEQLALRAAAVAFTALYAVATFLPDLPEGAYADATVLGLVNDGPSRTAILVGGGALTLAGLLFLAWTAALAARLDRDGSWLSRAVLLGGAGYGLCLMLAATAFTGVATGIAVGELEPADDPYLVRLASDLGFHLLLVPGLLCASLAVAAASALGRRSGALPPAVTVGGPAVGAAVPGAAVDADGGPHASSGGRGRARVGDAEPGIRRGVTNPPPGPGPGGAVTCTAWSQVAEVGPGGTDRLAALAAASGHPVAVTAPLSTADPRE
jgi:hypothetical protein